MRFAYIDSQGNEVTIPSVDALALRIELGAIGADTQLYDAQADRWGPAHTHEIFHTLSRDVGEEAGFVAPPPPVASEPEPPAAPEPTTSRPTPPATRFDVAEDLGLAPQDPAPESVAPDSASSDSGDLGFDFTLTEAFAPGTSPGQEEPAESDAEPQASPPDTPPAASAGESVSFDFGDLGPLELEAAPADESKAGPMEGFESGSAQTMDFAAGDDEASMDFASPSDETFDFSSPGGGGGGELGGLDLEPSMADFDPSAPPAWMEQSGPSGEADTGAMSFGPAGAEESEDDRPARAPRPGPDERGAPRPDRPEPRTRPSPPRRTQRSALPALIGGVAVVAVLGGGGYLGYTTFFKDRAGASAGPAAPRLPEVTIPEIPAELLPRMRDLGEAALTAAIVDLDGAREQVALSAEPNGEWLAGVYLANASRFRDVQGYWEGIGAFVDSVRATDTRAFHERYVAQLQSAGITGDTASMLLARADSGFLATRADRFEAYAQMDDLVNAALDLHTFLLTNEASIEYTPAAGGVSRDPVLEAAPATEELGDRMWDMVDRITAALDALGTLDRVTTERLSAVLFDRVRQAGFR